jgi:hypothetical protein
MHMKNTTLRILLIVLVAVLALSMAGCKGESSPTAPSNTTTVPPSGGVTPPTGATLTLTVTPTANPLVSSKVTVTATVTANGQPVADGTAVQFTTTLGTFADTGLQTTIRTTTNGVATVSLSSTSAGPATVTATVNNVTKTTVVTFGLAPVIPPGPNTTPTITTVCVVTGSTCTTPATGIPAGGQQVVINGTNFRTPVRVLFDPGNGQPAKEAFVNSVTDTKIVAIAPSFNITTGQTLPVTITVITAAGTATEQSASQANAFTYQLAILTPSVRTLTPTSGSIDGGTAVAILGDAFQAPVQVFFNAAEAQVVKVTFNEIDVISPTARDTTPNASGPFTGSVDVKVRNVASGKETTFPAGFRYIAKMAITAVTPTTGPATGGTDITIDGTGFVAPVTVDIGPVSGPAIRAQVLKVSGTQILARTGPTPSPCSSLLANLPVTVTNINNGDSATTTGTTQNFTYIPVPSVITSVSASANPIVPGTSLTVTVQNPGVGSLGNALISFQVGDQTATVTPSTITTGTGSTSFNVIVPSTLTFPPGTAACTAGGLPGTRQFDPLIVPVTFLNNTTACTATSGAITIQPPTNACVTPPNAVVTAPAPPACAAAPSVAAGGNSSTSITIQNTGTSNLVINPAPTVSGADAADFTVTPTTAKTVAPAGSTTYTVTFHPATTGAKTATVTFLTNDPNNPSITVCLNGTGT